MIPTAITMIQTELGRLEDGRAKYRQWAMLIVGAIIAFSVRDSSRQPAISESVFLGVAGIVISSAFWYQDYRLHRLSHGWRKMGSRTRNFIRGEIPPEEFKLLKYNDADEDDAKWYCLGSTSIFGTLILGSVASIIYRILIR